jgi:broad specificity phosphatase PhoE
MNIYFVRHGQSELNKEKVHQYSHTPLSELGQKQAELVAERLSKIQVDKIISSPYLRTKQTTEIINKKLKKPLEFSILVAESRHNPSILEGKSYEDPELESINKLLNENYSNPNFRHSNEENFFDFKERCLKALEFLENQKEENILVITHSFIIIMMVTLMIWREKTTPENYLDFRRILHTDNTGITWCQFDGASWRLITWNDSTHIR